MLTREELLTLIIQLGITTKELARELGVKHPNYISTVLRRMPPAVRLSYGDKTTLWFRIQDYVLQKKEEWEREHGKELRYKSL